MRRAALLALCLLLCLPLCGCAEKEASFQGFYMDTLMSLTVRGARAEELLSVCSARLAALENALSATKETSEVTAINQNSGRFVPVGEDTYAVVALALEYAALTKGAYDPTVLPAILAWDRMSGSRIPTEAELAALRPLIGYEGVELDPDARAVRLQAGQGLDLGGIAKGYAADVLAALCREYGCSGILNLGGNVYAVGSKADGSAWRVAVQSPRSEEAYLAVKELRDEAAVTSGDYQRYFMWDGVRYHHILDPDTLCPAASGLCSATIFSENAALADALATACIVLGEEGAEALLRELPARAVLVRMDQSVRELG